MCTARINNTQNQLSLISLVTLAFFLAGCSNREPLPDVQSAGGPSTIRWVFSYADTAMAHTPDLDDSGWDIFYAGLYDSLRVGNAMPPISGSRLHLSIRTLPLNTGKYFLFDVPDTARFSVRAQPSTIPIRHFLYYRERTRQWILLIDSLVTRHPEIRLITIENDAAPAQPTYRDNRLIPFSEGIPEESIRDEQNQRLVRIMQRMDSLLIRNKINEFQKFIHQGYSDNGVTKEDKMNFYKYIAVQLEGMHFDYGNFLFHDLDDGRKLMMYRYNLWKGDSLVDGGQESRYFKLVKGIWKETGNQSRFYRTTISQEKAGGDRQFYIYLPPDYFDNLSRNYPVNYVFHDFNDQSRDWVAYRIGDFLDTAITRQLIQPMVVVFLDGGPSLFMNAADTSRIQFEDFFMQTVGVNTEMTLRVKRTRDARFLTGFGQGGLAAMYYLLKYPTFFSSVAVVNGRLTQTLMASHVDGGDPEYWSTKYPSYFLNMMPDYILKNLNFILLQQENGPQMEDFSTIGQLLRQKNASVNQLVFRNSWQENMGLIVTNAVGGHLKAPRSR